MPGFKHFIHIELISKIKDFKIWIVKYCFKCLQEYPNPQPYVQKVPKPTEEAYKRIHQPQFPYLDWLHVQEVIDEGIAKNNLKSK